MSRFNGNRAKFPRRRAPGGAGRLLVADGFTSDVARAFQARVRRDPEGSRYIFGEDGPASALLGT